jgi:sulfite reductase (ferredoxin)
MGQIRYNANEDFYPEELDWLEEKIKAYRSGGISNEELLELRLSFGIYRQRDHSSHMFRQRLPAGQMTAHYMDVLADITERYSNSEAHVTTRQDIQLHYVPLEAAPSCLREVYEECGMINKGACGDGVRNIKCDYLAGVDPDEAFNPQPYSLAAADFFAFHPHNLNFGRKFKPSFTANPEHNQGQTSIDCLGFVAKKKDGKKGWKVTVGGGLGASPFKPKTLFEFLPVEKTLLVCDALVRIFQRLGERKNRNRARLKYLVESFGEERFRELVEEEMEIQADGWDYEAELEERMSDHEPIERDPIDPVDESDKDPEQLFPDDEHAQQWVDTQVYDQKQDGYASVVAYLPLGDMDPTQMRRLADIARDYGSTEARTTAQQHLCLPWIKWEDVPEVYERLKSIGLDDAGHERTFDVTACYAENCDLALIGARQIARITQKRLLDEFGKETVEEDVRIRVDGCFNACAQHQIADIGFTGVVVKNPREEGPPKLPYYNMTVGGGEGDEYDLGDKDHGKVPMEGVPEVCVALVEDYWEWRSNGESFQDYYHDVGMDRVKSVVKDACDYIEPGESLKA